MLIPHGKLADPMSIHGTLYDRVLDSYVDTTWKISLPFFIHGTLYDRILNFVC